MTANELRDNCREYYWQEIQANKNLKAQYEDMVEKMTAVSRKGINELILPVKEVLEFVPYLKYSGFEVYPSEDNGEITISWKK